MELGLALTVLSPQPVLIEERRLIFATWGAPLPVPMAWVEPGTAANWILARDDVEPEIRVLTALQAGLPERAWALIHSSRTGCAENPRIDLALASWAARRQADLALPATNARALLVGVDDPDLASAVDRGVRDFHQMLGPLPWPRWAGPLVLVADDRTLGVLGNDGDLVPRPALPLARIAVGETEPLVWRQAAARTACRVYLALSYPPTEGWPAWFHRGLIGIADAKAQGLGPSPRAMWRHRRRAGIPALMHAMQAKEPDPALATALCAPLCHSLRRHRLGELCELLRNQVDGPTAIRIAYGMSIEDMVARP